MAKTRTRSMTLVGAALCVAPVAFAQPQFKGMGAAPPGPFGSTFVIYSMSDEGEVFGDSGGQAMTWSSSKGFVPLIGLDPPNVGLVDSCTPSGSKLVGRAQQDNRIVPVVWTDRTKPPLALPGFPIGWTAQSVECSADAKVIIGSMASTPTLAKKMIFIWRSGIGKSTSPGWEFISQFPAGMESAAVADLTADGSIGFGGSAWFDGSFQGVRWSKTGGIVGLGDFPGDKKVSTLRGCSGNGALAVGYGVPADGEYTAAIWTESTQWVAFGQLKPEHNGAGFNDVDNSGRMVVGTSDFTPADPTGILWSARDGMRSVKDVLTGDYGLVEASGWQLRNVQVISPNGRFMGGIGKNPQGKFESWWAEIRPFCYADCDNSTSPKGKNAGPPVLDIDDFICFMTKYAVGDYLYADCDLNGYLEIDDFICFITKFATGCD